MKLQEIKRQIQIYETTEVGIKIDRRPFIFYNRGKSMQRSFRKIKNIQEFVVFSFQEFISLPLEVIEEEIEELKYVEG